jgi:hypothetical protein
MAGAAVAVLGIVGAVAGPGRTALWVAIALGAPLSLLFERVASRRTGIPPHWENWNAPGGDAARSRKVPPSDAAEVTPRAHALLEDAEDWPLLLESWPRVRQLVSVRAQAFGASGGSEEALFGDTGAISRLVDALVAKAHAEIDRRFVERQAQLERVIAVGPTRTRTLLEAAQRKDENTDNLQVQLESIDRARGADKVRDPLARRRRRFDAEYARVERLRLASAREAERLREQAFGLVAETQYAKVEQDGLAEATASLKAAERAQGDAVVQAARMAFALGEQRRRNIETSKAKPKSSIDPDTERAIDEMVRDILGE